MKVDTSDHGTWIKYPTVRESIYVMPYIAELYKFYGARNCSCWRHPRSQKECSWLALPALSKPNAPSMYRNDPVGQNSNLVNPYDRI
jgi:hypothetical protein